METCLDSFKGWCGSDQVAVVMEKNTQEHVSELGDLVVGVGASGQGEMKLTS